MLDPKKIEEVVESLSKAIPPGLTAMQSDVEKNVRSALSGMFAKLDLVTREEFDVQSQVLQRTRAKLEVLAQKVTELEKTLVSEKK
jgi:BMFP domain-containing protein YqiC